MKNYHQPRSAGHIGRWLLLAAGVLLVLGLLVALRRGTGDPLPEMAGMPFAFITAEAAGYDAEKVVLWRGGSIPPASIQVDGQTAWPAYEVDPAFAPARNGVRWITPLISDAQGQHTAPLPPRSKVLGGQTPGALTPYLAPEAVAMLDKFRAAHGH